MRNRVFWIFGVLQSASLAAVIYLVFGGLGAAAGAPVIGLDTQITLSLAFPLFLLLVEYAVYTRR